MTAGTLDTVIRMNVDSAQGVASTNKLNTAMTSLKSRGVTTLGSGFGSLATQALSASGAAERLGVKGTFLSGSLSMAAQSLGMMSPVLLIATVGITALATAFLNKREEIKKTTRVVELNSDALTTLIAKNASVVDILDAVRLKRIEELEAERAALEAHINNRNILTETFDKENQQAILRGESLKLSEEYYSLLKSGNGTLAEQVARLAAVMAELDKLNEAKRKAVETTAKLAEQQERLNAANEDALTDLYVEQLRKQADNAQRLLDIEVQRAQLAARGQGGGLAEIVAGSEAIIAAEQAAHEQRLAEANAFDGSRQVLEAEFTLFVEQEEQRRTQAVLGFTKQQIDAKKKADAEAAKSKETWLQKELKATAMTAAQMLIIQKASLGETIEAIIAEQQARLASIAIVAAIEAVFYAFTNPAAAASKAAAAVMAGAGAGALGALRGAFAGSGGGEQSADELSLTGDSTASSSQRTGRTLVQQGPITLNYHAVLTVQGHVLDITNLHDLFSEWNGEQLRRAGFDTKQRARGNG